jgi:cytochrome c oxidase assembly protein subunit 15
VLCEEAAVFFFSMQQNSAHTAADIWLPRFAWLTSLATLMLIAVGGLVTSHGAGMAVPDWPNSYGYNMFLFPVSKWVGGILYEHSHRLIATVVGVLTVALTRWVCGKPSRVPLIFLGIAEIVSGTALTKIFPHLKGAGYFLSGIGTVVLLAGIVWFDNRPRQKPLPGLAWCAFFLVQVQGLLGGLRVVLLADKIGIFHATLAQLFFCLLCAIAFLCERASTLDAESPSVELRVSSRTKLILSGTTFLIFCQLILGATMRHQHAGLSIPDFPLAYGKLWPNMDPQSIERYNQQRVEIESVKPITAGQVELQMVHRIVAAAILIAIGCCAAMNRKQKATAPGATGESLSRWSKFWLMLVLVQVCLGAWTIWSGKAADVATAHVIIGALLLATGAIISIVSHQPFRTCRDSRDSLSANERIPSGGRAVIASA